VGYEAADRAQEFPRFFTANCVTALFEYSQIEARNELMHFLRVFGGADSIVTPGEDQHRRGDRAQFRS